MRDATKVGPARETALFGECRERAKAEWYQAIGKSLNTINRPQRLPRHILPHRLAHLVRIGYAKLLPILITTHTQICHPSYATPSTPQCTANQTSLIFILLFSPRFGTTTLTSTASLTIVLSPRLDMSSPSRSGPR